MRKNSEYNELTLSDLRERIDAEKVNMAQLKINHAISPVENTSKIRKARRDIARMMTILGQRENNEKK